MVLEHRRMLTLVLVPWLAGPPGCIGVRAKSESVNKSWPPEASKCAQSLTLRVAMKLFINGTEDERFPNLADEARKTALETYDSAQLFQSVISDSEPGAIVAEAVLEDHEKASNALMILFIFVSTIIPAYVEDHLTLTTTFTDANGHTLATIRKSAKMTTWMEFFLIFAMPFAHPSSVMHNLQTNLHRETIHEAISLGVLTAAR